MVNSIFQTKVAGFIGHAPFGNCGFCFELCFELWDGCFAEFAQSQFRVPKEEEAQYDPNGNSLNTMLKFLYFWEWWDLFLTSIVGLCIIYSERFSIFLLGGGSFFSFSSSFGLKFSLCFEEFWFFFLKKNIIWTNKTRFCSRGNLSFRSLSHWIR